MVRLLFRSPAVPTHTGERLLQFLLQYNSGSGNCIFGLGWSLDLDSIKRKTDKKLPLYIDESESDSDVFLLSEAEDLVPEFQKENDGSFSIDAGGEYILKKKNSPDGLHSIRYYKPRIEGLFARIERWTEKSNGRMRWRVITKENITTLFGWTNNSVVMDPAIPLRLSPNNCAGSAMAELY